VKHFFFLQPFGPCYIYSVWKTFSVLTVKGHNRPECQVKVIFSNCEVLGPFWPGQI